MSGDARPTHPGHPDHPPAVRPPGGGRGRSGRGRGPAGAAASAPARTTRARERVVVIGAGLAGLACAYRLQPARDRCRRVRGAARPPRRPLLDRTRLRRRPGRRARGRVHRHGPRPHPQARRRARARPRGPRRLRRARARARTAAGSSAASWSRPAQIYEGWGPFMRSLRTGGRPDRIPADRQPRRPGRRPPGRALASSRRRVPAAPTRCWASRCRPTCRASSASTRPTWRRPACSTCSRATPPTRTAPTSASTSPGATTSWSPGWPTHYPTAR